ncbi:unnamed protein product [Trichobilharzia regenti]|nr:unnamed protein product [Trichobilharzia regenti]
MEKLLTQLRTEYTQIQQAAMFNSLCQSLSSMNFMQMNQSNSENMYSFLNILQAVQSPFTCLNDKSYIQFLLNYLTTIQIYRDYLNKAMLDNECHHQEGVGRGAEGGCGGEEPEEEEQAEDLRVKIPKDSNNNNTNNSNNNINSQIINPLINFAHLNSCASIAYPFPQKLSSINPLTLNSIPTFGEFSPLLNPQNISMNNNNTTTNTTTNNNDVDDSSNYLMHSILSNEHIPCSSELPSCQGFNFSINNNNTTNKLLDSSSMNNNNNEMNRKRCGLFNSSKEKTFRHVLRNKPGIRKYIRSPKRFTGKTVVMGCFLSYKLSLDY